MVGLRPREKGDDEERRERVAQSWLASLS